MKKKSVRKVSASKKPTLKTKQKIKKPSLLPWLIAGLLIFATVGYWYFQAKPESIKILQIAGTVEDYISPVPVDINIVTAGRKLPMSDTPEVNAMVAANQVIRQAVKDGKAPKDVEAEAERAAVQAARDTYVQLGNTPQGQSSTTTAPTPKPTTQEIIKKANEDAAVAMSTLKNVTYTKVGDDVIAKTNSAPAGGGSGAGCPTVAGFSAGEGQTMIGDVDSDSKKDNVYRCVNGKWEDAKCDFDKENPSACPVTVKPMYLTEGKNLNCTSGGVVIGDGTVDKSAGKVCKGGVLEDAPKSGGAFKTPEEIAKLKETCLRNGGGWTDDNTCGVGKESCERGGGFWNGKICDKNRGSIAEFDCTKQGSAYKWDNSTKKCVETPKVGANTFSKQDVCEGALKDKNKESCIRSTDNPNLWMVVPKGTTTINSGVTNTTSSEINKPTTSNTTFKSGADCDRAKTQGFTCEPIAGGNYYKLTPVSQLPETQRIFADAPGSFGNSDTSVSQSWRKVEKATECNSATEKSHVVRGNPEDGGGIYCAPKDIEKGSLKAGDSCDGKNDLCSSGDCRSITNQSGERGWYCMSEQSHVERTWADSWVKYSVIGTPVAYAVQFARGFFWVKDNTLPNGAYCFGQANACKSGYCANNRTFDTCETDPFSSSANNNKRCAPGEIDSSIEVINNGKWEYSGITCPFGCENGECKDPK